MNPDNQQPFSSGSPYDMQPASASGAPKKHWSPLRKVLTIVGIVVGVLVIAVVLLFVFGNGKKTPKTAQKTIDPTLYKSRPGYTDVTDAIGDPGALVQLPTGNVVRYGGQDVIQACNVASLKDISDAGFYVSANPIIGNVSRTFFDGKGAGPIKDNGSLFLPSEDDSNSCLYKFQSGKGDNLMIAVYQPSYTNVAGMNANIAYDYNAAPDAHGLQILTQKPPKDSSNALPNVSNYIIRSGNTAAQISIDTADTTAKNKLLDRIETNFAAALNAPAPLANFDYQSPIFSGSVTLACSLTDNSTIKTVIGTDASPLVTESVASAIGVIEHDNGKAYNYVDNSCERRGLGDTYTNVPKVRVVTETFENAEGAKGAFAYAKSSPFAGGITATPTTIGDESFFGDTADVDHAIVFRKGRVIVFTTYDLATGKDKTITPSARMQALMPAMTQIANNVKNY